MSVISDICIIILNIVYGDHNYQKLTSDDGNIEIKNKNDII